MGEEGKCTHINPLAPNDIYIYICRALSPLNGRTAIKVDGGGFDSGVKGLREG